MEISGWTDYDRVAFAVLSPLCQDLIKNPQEETLLKLQSLIDDVPTETLQMYQRYIFMPLIISLMKKETRFTTKQQITDCLAKFIGKTKVFEVDQFMKIFSEAFRVISDSSLHKIVPDAPEELKLSVVKCVTVLISNSSHDVISSFYCEKNMPLISHGIYFCLALINEEMFLDLRLAALECLMHVCQVHGEVNSSRQENQIRIGHILMFCLPGIVLNLRKVINPDEKQNHKLTMMALRAWSRITASVMEDNSTGIPEGDCDDWIIAKNDLLCFIDNKKQEIARNSLQDNVLNSLKGKERTKEWYTNASKSMYRIVHEICLMNFSSWKVRLEMATSAELLLSCSRNMKECVPSFVGLLLILSEDETTDVSEKSKRVLRTFSEKFEKCHPLVLMEMMEDHFLKVAHQLSNSIRGEAELKTNLNLMCGYLRLLGEQVQRVIRSNVHLNAMSSALVKIIALDYFVVSPVEDWSLGTSESDILKAIIPWKCFKFFKDPLIFGKFKEICQLLGQNGDHILLSSHFLNIFYQDYENQKEVTLIINEIFSNASSSDQETIAPIMKRIIESYVDPEVWDAQKIEDSDRNGNVQYLSVTDIRSRHVQACLLVEGLGMFGRVATSNALNASFASWYFRICLYPILERIGHPNPMLSGAGKLAIAHISEGTKTPIPSIILSNSDYITHHIVLKLRRTSGFSSPAPLHVLVAILELASPDILTNLEEAVGSVVKYGFKYVNDQKAINSLKCLFVFTKFVNKMFPKQRMMALKDTFGSGSGCDDNSECTLVQGRGSVTQKIMEYQRCRKIANAHNDNEQDTGTLENEENLVSSENNGGDGDMMEDLTKPNLPKHVQLTITVLKQVLSLISSKDKEKKLMAMDILSEGIWIIEGYADELLPFVHQMWSPLSVQFTDNDPLVVHRAFNLLLVLALVAKDFIRERTLSKVLPHISKFLLKQSSASLKKDSGSAYRFSQVYKLQLSILRGLGELALLLDFQEQDVSEILTSSSPYLSSLQPQPLQDACVKTYKLLCRVDRNIVLLKLMYLGNIYKNMKPPSEEFELYHVPDRLLRSQEYEKNASLLVQCMYHNA